MQRAGAAAEDHDAGASGSGDRPPADDRDGEPAAERALGERARGRVDAGVVGPRHRPHRRLVALARGGDEARAGAQASRGRAAARVERAMRPAVGRAGARRRRCARGRPRAGAGRARRARRSTGRRRRAASASVCAVRSPPFAAGTPSAPSVLKTSSQAVVARVGALDPHRQPAAAEAVHERLGERADDRGHAHRGAPVVAVPPDAVAGVQPHRGRALRRLDPVDVVEPVERPPVAPAARDAVDALHEAAAEARRDLRVALEQPHDGLRARDLRRLEVALRARAEVLRDGEARLRRRAARPRAAAGRAAPRALRGAPSSAARRPRSSERRRHCGCGPGPQRCRG